MAKIIKVCVDCKHEAVYDRLYNGVNRCVNCGKTNLWRKEYNEGLKCVKIMEKQQI
jgi:predicted RNA-binding Zn-ribbon protein involved in translation (DUF1610 family)